MFFCKSKYLYFFLGFLLLVNRVEAAELYIVESGNGTVTFTSKRPKYGRYRTLKSSPKKPGFSYINVSRGRGGGRRRIIPMKSQYDHIIRSKAREYGIDPALVKAVVHVESAFKASAVSRKGAKGLMQLMPQTAKRFGVRNAFSPEENINGGVEYLSFLLKYFPGRENFAVAAYNAGEGAVKKYRGIPPFRETQDYVSSVMYAKNLYRNTTHWSK